MMYTVENCPRQSAKQNKCVNGKYKCGGCGGIWKTCPVCKGRKAAKTLAPQHKAVTGPEHTASAPSLSAGQTEHRVKIRIDGKLVDYNEAVKTPEKIR